MGVGGSCDLVGRDATHGLKPVVGGDDLRGVGGGGKDLGDERVRIKSNGGCELFELLGGEALVRLLIEVGGLCGTGLVGIGGLVRVVLIALRRRGLLWVLLLGIGLLAVRLAWIRGLLLRVGGVGLGVSIGLPVLIGAGLLGILLLGEGVDLGQREQERGHAKGDGPLRNQTQTLLRFAAGEEREQGRAESGRAEFHIPSQRLPMSRLSFRGPVAGRLECGPPAIGSWQLVRSWGARRVPARGSPENG